MASIDFNLDTNITSTSRKKRHHDENERHQNFNKSEAIMKNFSKVTLEWETNTFGYSERKTSFCVIEKGKTKKRLENEGFQSKNRLFSRIHCWKLKAHLAPLRCSFCNSLDFSEEFDNQVTGTRNRKMVSGNPPPFET
ncbi:hypothetical protein TNCT_471471 [Trichonephila clavata]|uniref:Uncharacterized protein n=1 Tax=Trichonephila clavata TaxID=2740835 RepID=A0A8X6LUY2_TRICU|nr:hypothetical protein TNCT_471471 [Trichonephila clavata]